MSGQVRLLLALRFRTMFRGRTPRRTALVVASALLLLVPLSLLSGLAVGANTLWLADGGRAALAGDWAHLVLFSVFVLLVLMPVLGFAGNDFYDVTRLFHLPVSHRTVLTAQTLGMLLSGTTFFFLPALVALAVTLPGGPGAAILRLALLPLFLFHAAALSQTLQLLLLGTLRSRRFRDLAGVLAAAVSAGIFVLLRLLFAGDRPQERIAEALESGFADWLVFVPSRWVSGLWAPGAGGGAILVFALAFLPLTALLNVVAAALQERAFHGEVATPRLGVARGAARGSGPFRILRGVVPDQVLAVAGKEVRLFRRDPSVVSMLLQQSVFFLVPVALAIWRTELADASWVAVWGLYALLFVESLLAMNLLGLEGGGAVLLLGLPVSSRRVLMGKTLWYGALFGAVNAAAMLLLSVLLLLLGRPLAPGRIAALPFAAVAGVLVMLAIGAVFTALVPTQLTARSRRALAQQGAGRGGCGDAAIRAVGYMLLLVLLVPVFLLCTRPLLGPLAILYGAALLAAGLRLGSALLDRERERLYLSFTRGPG